MPKRILAIYNPTAGRRRRRRATRTFDLLRAAGASLAIRETAGRGDAEAFARDATIADWDVLVAAGGDGTINEAINGLTDRAPPLAILPLGTANVLALEIGLGLGARAAAATILEGRPTEIHLGQAGERKFVMMAGCGFDAEVVAAVDTGLKRRIGKAAYVLQTIRQSWRYRFPGFQVTADGQSRRATSVIVANGRRYAGRFTLAPAARLTEPVLYACLFTRPGAWHVLRYGWGLMAGRLDKFPDVEILAASAILIEGRPGDPLQSDGDIIAGLPVTIRPAKRPITLLFPPPQAAS